MAALNKEKHIKYWQRCYNSYLPTPYTSSDSTRLMWACFITSAYDLLSIPFSSTDRTKIRSWVLSLQHPDGGFCGSPTHSLPGQESHKGTANLAATFFALITLAIASDGEEEAKAAFAGVRRGKLLRWLKKLQRDDGSFGQNLWEGKPVGGRDTRHSYLASCVRWMLRGHREDDDEPWEDDVDVKAMIAHLRRGQTYDGGLAEFSEHESHAGYAYCAVGALWFLDRPSSASSPRPEPSSLAAMDQGIPDRPGMLRFLAGRQFNYLAGEEDDEEEEEENFIQDAVGSLTLEEGCRHVGFNGRWNKKADTCYAWWVAATLAMLGSPYPVSVEGSRRYLLEVTQHPIGGFGKFAGTPPDIYHSYLGLAVLAVFGDADLKDFDVGLCCSKETTGKIEKAREGLLKATEGEDQTAWASDGFWAS
ncbi:unnamed protein product [Clonostachys solani]|uniref:Prenyltransferase alpha-alpha toroid domain-containing protein n=1 Tax=Clonostachys solani TaxID=160281 RepID=A0A9P0EJB4_9HYPO|nr:unnamed protein product [Clonostachys solani]